MIDERISICISDFQARYGDVGAIELAHDLGLSQVDFDLIRYDYHKEGSLYRTENLSAIAAHFREVRARADALGVKIAQTHGRIAAYRQDDAWNEGELAGFARDALATEILGAPYCVVHAVHLGLDVSPETHRAINLQMFSDFLPHAAEHGIMLASETLGDTHMPDGREGLDLFATAEELLRAHHRICAANPRYKDSLCICMDTGHINKTVRFGQMRPENFIRTAGSLIRCLHLNDNNGLTDQHKEPLSGSINWDEIMNALSEIGYNGTYNMELNLRHYGTSDTMLRAHAAFAIQVMDELLRTHA